MAIGSSRLTADAQISPLRSLQSGDSQTRGVPFFSRHKFRSDRSGSTASSRAELQLNFEGYAWCCRRGPPQELCWPVSLPQARPPSRLDRHAEVATRRPPRGETAMANQHGSNVRQCWAGGRRSLASPPPRGIHCRRSAGLPAGGASGTGRNQQLTVPANTRRSQALRASSSTHISAAHASDSSQTSAPMGAVPNSQLPAGV